jgi:hypothetical protein
MIGLVLSHKLGYIRNLRVKETLLLLWGWGLALLGAWMRWLSQQPAWQQWGVRKTKGLGVHLRVAFRFG